MTLVLLASLWLGASFADVPPPDRQVANALRRYEACLLRAARPSNRQDIDRAFAAAAPSCAAVRAEVRRTILARWRIVPDAVPQAIQEQRVDPFIAAYVAGAKDMLRREWPRRRTSE